MRGARLSLKFTRGAKLSLKFTRGGTATRNRPGEDAGLTNIILPDGLHKTIIKRQICKQI